MRIWGLGASLYNCASKCELVFYIQYMDVPVISPEYAEMY